MQKDLRILKREFRTSITLLPMQNLAIFMESGLKELGIAKQKTFHSL